MNDVLVASENQEESTDARDFVELGDVSTETKGFASGKMLDGAGGYWF